MENYVLYNGGHPGQWLRGMDEFIAQEKMNRDGAYTSAWAHLSPRVQACLDSVRQYLVRMDGQWTWNYERLRAALREIHSQIEEQSSTETTVKDAAIGLAKTAAVVGAAALAAPVVATAGLAVVGFGSAGVVGGSIAAGIQSIFYGGAVASGSAFAFCQSLAMGGAAAAATVAGTGAAAGGAASVISEIVKERPSKSWDDREKFIPTKELLEALATL